MKSQLKRVLVAAVASMLLAGCTSTRHVTKWEYKVAMAPGFMVPAPAEVQEKFLNDMTKEGWTLVQEDAGRFYFKRPKR
jgi:hypothetical protein